MPKLFKTYWYQEVAAVKRAALYNLRDLDLKEGGAIPAGSIVGGQCGFAVAERVVEGYTGKIRKYRPNRRVEWRGMELRCMALDGLPIGAALQKGPSILRHRHYVVVGLERPEELAEARSCRLPFFPGEDGLHYATLEVFVVPGKTPVCRRAKLL